ncbi:MAG: cupin domain-containing protein [Eubacteriales bacterium]|nr:cupin domain-containing protein [Eubacteriales bacterium]
MICFKKDTKGERKTKLGGTGKGYATVRPLLSELPGNLTMLSEVTLEPGATIGMHTHTGDGEVYICTEGSLTITDDDTTCIISAGDTHLCEEGHRHGVLNHTDKPASILAFIIYAGDEGQI